MSDSPNDPKDFASQAAEGEDSTLVGEFVEFLKDNKKWWLAPIVISVLGLGLLVLLGGSAAAPFIYTLF
jgi:predicted cobalt transporter CbtA